MKPNDLKRIMASLTRAATDDQVAIAYVLAGDEAGASSRTKGEIRAFVRDRMLRLFGDVAERLPRPGMSALSSSQAASASGISAPIATIAASAFGAGLLSQ